MTCEEVIDGILERKKILNTTNQQISDASGVPKATVDRILRKETPNPSFQTIMDMATAVGYDFSPRDDFPVDTDDEKLRQIIYLYEKRCEALEKESRLKTVQSNLVIAEKDRTIQSKDQWVRRLFNSLVILGVCVMIALLIDVCLRGIGWFP